MMLFDVDSDTLYQALLERDPSYEGRAFVCVSSTGVFCRLTCPARKPKRKNCSFYESVADCMAAGFRPCKRCSPLIPQAEADPSVRALTEALEHDPTRRWSERDVANMGFDPSTVRRAFKRHFGVTFLEMARQRRLGLGFTALADGAQVIDAQLDAGFDSASGFRAAFAKLLGQAPAHFTGDEWLMADWIDTDLGAMVAVADQHALHLLEFTDRKALPTELKRLQNATKGGIGIGRTSVHDLIRTELAAFFSGDCAEFKTPLALHGTPFTKEVWQALRKIPAGETRSYGELAQMIGNPTASRAVARANGANQIALVIPCHRIIGADGSLTGYGGGLWRKQKLIELERQYAVG